MKEEEEEEKKTVNWEVCDPKPPVIRSGRRVAAGNSGSIVCGYPTYPDYARFDTDAVNSRFTE